MSDNLDEYVDLELEARGLLEKQIQAVPKAAIVSSLRSQHQYQKPQYQLV
jgi:hypothetical protein